MSENNSPPVFRVYTGAHVVRTRNIIYTRKRSAVHTDASLSVGEIMSQDSHTIEDLTRLYISQSPAAFTSIAMSAHQEPRDYSKRVDEEVHGGDSKCDYSCCNERGCCASPGCYAVLVGGIVCVCICCCYVSDGFFGYWTFWPY